MLNFVNYFEGIGRFWVVWLDFCDYFVLDEISNEIGIWDWFWILVDVIDF